MNTYLRKMNFIKKFYIRTTGYSYTNMGRLFLRLFVGIMMLQFGVRQLYDYQAALASMPTLGCFSPELILDCMLVIEIGCSFFIMCGFLTRLMSLASLVAMVIAECSLLAGSSSPVPYMLSWTQPGYLPVMFIGIYFFIILVGPGKISADYFLSLYIIHSDNHSESELEEV